MTASTAAVTPAESIVPNRADLRRLVGAAGALVLLMTAILAINLAPSINLAAGDLAPSDIRAPRALTFTNPVLTAQAQDAARNAVDPQYDYTTAGAIATSAQQLANYTKEVLPIDAAF